MISLLRIAAIILILWLVVRYLRLKFLERIKEMFGENSASKGGGQVADMVKDPQCGSFISVDNGVKVEKDGKEFYFCSKECAEKFSKPQEGST